VPKKNQIKAEDRGEFKSLDQEPGTDPSIHKDAPNVHNEEPNKEVIPETEVVIEEPKKPKDLDEVLNGPMKYIVDPHDAIERVEGLVNKIGESRPDLKNEVDQLKTQVESLEKKMASPTLITTEESAENKAPTQDIQPGQLVKVNLEEGVHNGQVVSKNEDGTYLIKTDKNMTLSNVPDTSIEVVKQQEAEGFMSLPASLKEDSVSAPKNTAKVKMAIKARAAIKAKQAIKAESMTVSEFEFESLGVNDPQYSPGMSSSGWDGVYIGIGDSQKESLEDAVEQAANSGCVFTPAIETEIDKQIDAASAENAVEKLLRGEISHAQLYAKAHEALGKEVDDSAIEKHISENEESLKDKVLEDLMQESEMHYYSAFKVKTKGNEGVEASKRDAKISCHGKVINASKLEKDSTLKAFMKGFTMKANEEAKWELAVAESEASKASDKATEGIKDLEKGKESAAESDAGAARDAASNSKEAAEKARKEIMNNTDVKASAFDKIEELELGGGMLARRKKGKKDAEGKEESTIEIVDKEGKVKDTLPDAFGEDTVSIIKLLRKMYEITEKDDKAEGKEDKEPKESKEPKEPKEPKENKDSEISEKPKALPKVEKEESKEEKEKLEAAQKAMENRIVAAREVVNHLVQTGHLQADNAQVNRHLLAGVGTLQAAQAAAMKAAIDHKIMALLAMPEAELHGIRASLHSITAKQVTVQASKEGLSPLMLGNLRVQASQPQAPAFSLGDAFSRGGIR
jgi:hypothetical protein